MRIERLRHPSVLGPLIAATALLVLGLVGVLNAGWGYGLLLVSLLLIIGAVASMALLLFTRRFDTESLRASAATLGLFGAWCYLFAVAALAGHYVHETLDGRMELRWILFGPAALAALIVLDVGLYRLLVARNLPTWNRYRAVFSRDLANPTAMRRTFVDDVVLHRTLLGVSGFRWFKHTMIYWGFALMFATELLAVIVRDGLPAFGLADIWEVSSHPVRLAFDFAYDFTGTMVLLGCLLAIVYRIKVNGTEAQKYSDTPTAVFLLLVVISGFVVEALRIAGAPADPAHTVSFAGYALSLVMPSTLGEGSALFEALWIGHVLGSCAFIAYVPIHRLVHSCATPMGRLMTSQKELLAAKKRAVLTGLMMQRSE